MKEKGSRHLLVLGYDGFPARLRLRLRLRRIKNECCGVAVLQPEKGKRLKVGGRKRKAK